jgi:hypothetical protein
MAINLLTAPTPAAPVSVADYVAQNELIEAGFLNGQNKINFDSDLILQGSIFQIGGAVYRADNDTAITGVASDYVKIVPAGATATAEYVSSLTGVTWDPAYNGYYDVGGNLYIFNEGKAMYSGEVASVFSRYLAQEKSGDVYVGRDLYVKRDLIVIDDLHVTDDADIDGDLNVDGGVVIDGTASITGILATTAVAALNGGATIPAGKDLSVGRDLAVGDDLTVTDDISIGGDLLCSNTGAFTGSLSTDNRLHVANGINISVALMFENQSANYLFDQIKAFLPAVSDTLRISGILYRISLSRTYHVYGAKRESATEIDFYTWVSGVGAGTHRITDGDSTTLYDAMLIF